MNGRSRRDAEPEVPVEARRHRDRSCSGSRSVSPHGLPLQQWTSFTLPMAPAWIELHDELVARVASGSGCPSA